MSGQSDPFAAAYSTRNPPSRSAGGRRNLRSPVLVNMVEPVARVDVVPPAVPDDDARLLARLAAGDEHALAVVFDTYGSVVYSLALAITQKQDAAERVVTDAFAMLWREARALDIGGRTLFSWLSGLVRSGALALRGVSTVALDPAPTSRLAAATDRLNALQRQVIELAYFGGFTRGDIARRLGRPEVEIAVTLRTAMDVLRDVLAPAHPVSPPMPRLAGGL